MADMCRNTPTEEEPTVHPFSAREYAKALNLLLQLYTVATEMREKQTVKHAVICMCMQCRTFRTVQTFIYHGEG